MNVRLVYEEPLPNLTKLLNRAEETLTSLEYGILTDRLNRSKLAFFDPTTEVLYRSQCKIVEACIKSGWGTSG